MADNQNHAAPVWDTLWTNIHLATMEEARGGYGIVEHAALAIAGGKIAWLGAARDLPGAAATLAREVRDGDGAWMTPGLVDCHTHLVYAGNRAGEFAQRLKGISYAEIAKSGGGILSTVRATREATEEELLQQTAKRLRAFLAEGVTTIEVKSGYGLNLESEIKMLRVARSMTQQFPVRICTTFLGAHALPPEFAGDKDGYIDAICTDILPKIAAANLADAVDGFCETIGFSPAQMSRVFSVAKRLGLAVKLHAEQLSDQGGAALAARYNALSADHLEYVSISGIKAMAAANTVAVLLPGAFYLLNETHKPPVAALRANGVRMALASDSNPGTSPVTSLLLMLNMGCTLFGLTPEEALAGITRNAAAALGLGAEIGTLETGKTADLALWDIAHPVELAYRIGANPCCGVVNNGVFRKREAT